MLNLNVPVVVQNFLQKKYTCSAWQIINFLIKKGYYRDSSIYQTW